MPRRPAVAEGLSARVVRFLEQKGFERTRAALGPSVRREASWNGRSTSANVEWVVERAAFDRGLLEDVRAAGIEVAIAPLRGLRHIDGEWHAQAGEQTWRAGFLVEARGRRAPGRRRHGPPAIALAQSWSGLAPRAATAVAPFEGGFAWFATGGAARLAAARRSAARAGHARDAGIRAASARVAGRRPAVLAGERTACRHEPGAGAARARAYPDRRCRAGARPALGPWRVRGAGLGDGCGAGGDHALAPSADAALAHAFYQERVEQAFLRFARIARDFYRLEERWHDAPFWHARRGWPDDLPAHLSPTTGAPQIRTKPVVEDAFVVAREVVVTADQPRGVFMVDGVPLVPLLRATQAGEIASLEAAGRCFDKAPSQIETALAWLRYRGLLS